METKKFTLNTKTTFASIDEECDMYERFVAENPFAIELKKITDALKDELSRYDIGLGCTCNEVEDIIIGAEYGFNSAEGQIAYLLAELTAFLSNYDFIVWKNGKADTEFSNHRDVAEALNKAYDIATA